MLSIELRWEETATPHMLLICTSNWDCSVNGNPGPSCGQFSIFKDMRIYPGHAGVEGNDQAEQNWTAEQKLSEAACTNPNEKHVKWEGTGFDFMRYINDDVYLSYYRLWLIACVENKMAHVWSVIWKEMQHISCSFSCGFWCVENRLHNVPLVHFLSLIKCKICVKVHPCIEENLTALTSQKNLCDVCTEMSWDALKWLQMKGTWKCCK